MFCLLYSPKQKIVKFHAQKQIGKKYGLGNGIKIPLQEPLRIFISFYNLTKGIFLSRYTWNVHREVTQEY